MSKRKEDRENKIRAIKQIYVAMYEQVNDVDDIAICAQMLNEAEYAHQCSRPVTSYFEVVLGLYKKHNLLL